MPSDIFDIRMHDGSRHFADLPETCFFDKLREYAPTLAGVTETGFITDWVTEVWLDFDFCRHQFSINNQHGDYWFFVEDPECPEQILRAVLDHFRLLLEA